MKKISLSFLAVIMAVMMLATTVSAVTIQELQNGKAAAQSEVAALQEQLTKTVKKLNKLEDQLVETGQKIEKAEKDLAAAIKQEKKQYEDMKLRIQFMYEDGDKSMVEELLANSTIADAVTQAEYISEVHTYDREKLDEYIATKEKIAQLKSDLEKHQADLKKTQKKFTAQKKELDNMIAEKQAVVAGFDQMIAQAYAAAAAAAAQRSANAGGGNNGGGRSGSSGGTNYQYTGGASGDYDAILKAAYSYQGVPYKWGGASKKGMDCSGFVMTVYGQATGKKLAHQSGAIYASGKKISKPVKGCIVCETGHVGIYVGNGKMINATQPGDKVRVTKVKKGSKFVTY